MIDDDDPRPRRPRTLLRAVVALLVAFLAGTVAMGYALTHWDVAARYLRPAEVAPVELVAPPQAVPAPVVVEERPPPGVIDGLDTRVAELEGRIGAIDARAKLAGMNADRAEALLVALATRRAVERGVSLGYLDPLLKARFGPAQPQAVATIIAAAQAPVTLDELRAGLEAVRPALLGDGPGGSWWDGVRRELAGLIVLRRTSAGDVPPEDRATQAGFALAAGHVDRALAEVARLPGRDAAGAWIVSARRYVAVRQALDTIEAAALLAPRPAAAAPPAADPPSVPVDPEATPPA